MEHNEQNKNVLLFSIVTALLWFIWGVSDWSPKFGAYKTSLKRPKHFLLCDYLYFNFTY